MTNSERQLLAESCRTTIKAECRRWVDNGHSHVVTQRPQRAQPCLKRRAVYRTFMHLFKRPPVIDANEVSIVALNVGTKSRMIPRIGLDDFGLLHLVPNSTPYLYTK